MWEAWAADEVVDAVEKTQHAFYYGQIGLGVVFVLVLGWLRNRETPSQFRPRDPQSGKTGMPSTPIGAKPGVGLLRDELAESRLRNPPASRLALPGIVLDGHPHEVLGISSAANAAEIQKAWRELMKRYHPDKVGRPGSREWTDAQRIAEVLNGAKDEMLARAARRKP